MAEGVRRLRLLIAAVLVAAGSVPGSAGAQTAPRRRPAPPPSPASSAASAPPAAPAPPAGARRLTLTGLPSAGDPGPACRQTCTRVRLVCEAAGDECGPRWTRCLQACAATPRR